MLDVAPVDHEIVATAIGTDAERIGDFRDFHTATHRGRSRLVSGYLMLSGEAGGGVTISSHGHAVGFVTAEGNGIVISAQTPFEQEAGSTWHAREAGFAVDICHCHSGVLMAADPGRLAIPHGARLTVVHGPAPGKVAARLALLTSLRRTGGRRG
jgi:hypothetical protein